VELPAGDELVSELNFFAVSFAFEAAVQLAGSASSERGGASGLVKGRGRLPGDAGGVAGVRGSVGSL